jgi:hypothetical protein
VCLKYGNQIKNTLGIYIKSSFYLQNFELKYCGFWPIYSLEKEMEYKIKSPAVFT